MLRQVLMSVYHSDGLMFSVVIHEKSVPWNNWIRLSRMYPLGVFSNSLRDI